VRLAGANLAAREFPQARKMNSVLSSGDEKAIVVLDYGRDDG